MRRASDYYADLGVSHYATERDIKSRFRRLAALHHPDKVMSSNSNNGGYSADSDADFFMHLKTASDTLLDPARRFAYERFGPDIAGWKRCVTVRDYVGRGAQIVVPYYGFAAVVMYALGLLGYLDWGRYWRWLTLVALCVFELHVATRPTFPSFLETFVNPLLRSLTAHPPYLPFQAIILARKISVALYAAFSQIGPLLQPPPPGQPAGAKPGETEEKALLQNLDRLEQTARSMDVDAARLMELEMAPFVGDREVIGSMRSKLKEWLVQNTIRSDPMVRDALGNSLQKRRIDAPAGARGTK